jgi:hypothetical protein
LIGQTGRANEALGLMQQAAKIQDRMIGEVFCISSDSQRMEYRKIVQGSVHAFLSLVLRYLPNDVAATRAAMDLILRRKAIGAGLSRFNGMEF